MSRSGFHCLSLLAICLIYTTSLHAEDWPQFRGHNATGVSTESNDLPVEFSLDEKVLWSAEVGEGIASPIIVNNLAYTTALSAENTFSVFCFDAGTGKEIWRRDFETGELPPIMTPNKQASSTPACDGQNVYVYFSTLGLFALKADNGEDVWELPVPMPYYLMGWGAAHSPIVHGDYVIFNQDDDLAPFLMAVDKNTGSPAWRTERPDMLGGYSVPVIYEGEDRTEVIVAGTGKLKGYDLKDGTELWTCNSLLRTIMTTPVVKDGHVYVSVQSYEIRTVFSNTLFCNGKTRIRTRSWRSPNWRKRSGTSSMKEIRTKMVFSSTPRSTLPSSHLKTWLAEGISSRKLKRAAMAM